MRNPTMTHPHHEEDSVLLRLVTGELDAESARRLEVRLGEDPELRRRYERLRASWEGLELEPPPPIPEAFSAEVMASARRLEASEIRWTSAPAWVRAGAAAALVVGLVAGIGAGRPAVPPAATGDAVSSSTGLDALFDDPLEADSPSLAEAYWQELEGGGETLFGETSRDNSAEPEGEAL